MRILLTTDTVGGVWAFTLELAGGLLYAGHEVALVSFGREPLAHQQQWFCDTARRYGRRFVAHASDVPLEWMPENENAFSAGATLLLEVCDRFAPDVLHSSQLCWGALDVPLPVLVTAHSDVLSWAEACEPGGLEDNSWLRRYVHLVQAGLDGAAAVIAPTAWMATALQRNFRVDTGVHVIANGRSVVVSDKHRKVQAVSVGRLWDKAKGLETLLHVSSPIPIVVAGECVIPARSTGSVTFAGVLSEEEIVKLFRESSLYIAASLYEPFGLAPLEAALCGCAIVARDLPSLHEVWSDAATYFSTLRELELALTSFTESPEHLAARRVAAFERAQTFPAERMTGEYLTLYRHLLDEQRNAAREQEVADYAS